MYICIVCAYHRCHSTSPQPVLGKMQRRPAVLDKQLAHELKNLRFEHDPFSVTVGKTMCTYDFYEGWSVVVLCICGSIDT